MPGFSLIFGLVIDVFSDPRGAEVAIQPYILMFCGLAAAAFVAGYAAVGFFSISSHRQAKRIRVAYLEAILRQEVAYFDANSPGEVATRLTEDTIAIQQGMAEKAGTVVQFLFMAVFGFVLGFARSWQVR